LRPPAQHAGPCPAKGSISSLLRAAGATLLQRLPPAGPDGMAPPGFVVLVDPEALPSAPADATALLAPAAALGAPMVATAWLMDSVSCLEQLAFDTYHHQA
jgi:hypothetical protein